MPGLALLVDFGSTFTKVVAADLERPAIVARAQHRSTVDTDVALGLERAIEALELPAGSEIGLQLASSSARGGLRLVAVGLVPELTAAAARQAALGAGAKVAKVFSHELTRADVDEIDALQPDLILLAGGTDGGNRAVVVHNAGRLAHAATPAPVIMAGNRVASDEVRDVLEAAGKTCYVTGNVLPELDRLEVDAVRAVIREVFVRHIVEAKGLGRIAARFDDVIVPTPAAVLDAAQLLADGTEGDPGLGPLMVVDVGGATTDVHSISSLPPGDGLMPRGLPEPVAKRTVEGDLGVRVNALSLADLAHGNELAPELREALRTPQAGDRARFLSKHTDALSTGAEDRAFDVVLASACVDLAVERHVGHVTQVYGARGPVRLLHGKDLRAVKALVGVGGVFAFGPEPARILAHGLARDSRPESLRPESATLLHDAQYVFYAMGLLARRHPRVAMRLLRDTLVRHG